MGDENFAALLLHRVGWQGATPRGRARPSRQLRELGTVAGAHDAVGILHLHLAALVGAHGAERLVLARGRLGDDNGRGAVSQACRLAHAHCGGGTYLNGAFGRGNVGVTFSAGGEQRTGCDGAGDEGCAAGEDARRRISFCGIDCGVDGIGVGSRGGACPSESGSIRWVRAWWFLSLYFLHPMLVWDKNRMRAG